MSANSNNFTPLLSNSAKWSVLTTDESFTPEHTNTTQYTTWYKIEDESGIYILIVHNNERVVSAKKLLKL